MNYQRKNAEDKRFRKYQAKRMKKFYDKRRKIKSGNTKQQQGEFDEYES